MNNRSTKGNEMNFDEMYHNLMAESGVEYPRDEDYTTYFAYKWRIQEIQYQNRSSKIQ